MLDCKNCFYHRMCPHIYNDDANKCNVYLDNSRVIVLPIKVTAELHAELSEYCNKRCVDEL